MQETEHEDNEQEKSIKNQPENQIEEFLTSIQYLDSTKIKVLRKLIQDNSLIRDHICLLKTIEEQYPIKLTQKNLQDKIVREKMSLPELTKYFKDQYQVCSQIIEQNNLENFQVHQLNKSNYYGEIVNGLKHGKGVLLNQNGSLYEGEFQSDFKSGKGFEVLKNFDCYYGDFLNGLPNGEGVINYKNSEMYVGQWLNGKKNGIGKWISLQGPFYIGEWNQGQAQGIGLHAWITGEIYYGEMKNNLKHGEGVEYFSNGDFYEGSYANGKPNGKGLYRWYNGSQYVGGFVNGLRHGKGCWVKNYQKSISDCYKGQFQNDKKSGKGKYIWANGTQYEGEFYNDKRNGFGTIIWNDGASYRGQWQDGLMNGLGEFSQDGSTLKGVWKQNQLIIQQMNSMSITRISLSDFPKVHVIRNETIGQDKQKEKSQIYAEDYDMNDRPSLKNKSPFHQDESTRDITSNMTRNQRKHYFGNDRNRKSKSLSRQKVKYQKKEMFQSQMSQEIQQQQPKNDTKSNHQSQNLFLNQSSLNESLIFNQQQHQARVAHKSIQVVEMKDQIIQTNIFNNRYQQNLKNDSAPISERKNYKSNNTRYVRGTQLGNIDEEQTMEFQILPYSTQRKNISHSPKRFHFTKIENINGKGQKYLSKQEMKLWKIKMEKLKLNPVRYDDLWSMDVVKKIRSYLHPKIWIPSVRHQYHHHVG